MVMERGVGLSGMISGFNLRDCMSGEGGTIKPECTQNYFSEDNLVDPSDLAHGDSMPPECIYHQGVSPEDSEIFSDIALTYISKMLMEEDMDDKVYMPQEGPALQAAEKPFYDILGEKYPPSPDRPPLYAYSSGSPDDSSSGHCGNSFSSGSSHGGGCPFDLGEHPSPQIGCFSADCCPQFSFSSSNSVCNVLDSVEVPQFVTGRVNNLFTESQSAWQFKRGVEEASKFLPDQNKLVIDLESTNLVLPKDQNVGLVKVKVENEEKGNFPNGSRNRKNPNHEDLDLEEGRSVKQSAVYSEEDLRSEMFDMVLLCSQGKPNNAISSLRERLQDGVSKSSKNGPSKGTSGGKSRGKRQVKKDVVDLRTLLIHCAQAVAADDRRSTGELLKQIRQHSSPYGDGSQRLAHCFADGLEARLAGTGSQIYHSIMAKRQSATAILKAYHLYLAACPFKKISHFFANQTILDVAENATRLHIIDFGIYFGFQWPCLIQRLSLRPGGPPKLRITGIDVPQPGFRPNERIEETGRRLAEYAKMFKVEFEYHPIASKWEAIQIADLKIDRDEVLVVNCLYRFRNLVDETVVVDSPRNTVLNNIRKLNPDVFIHGVINGAFSAPFFVTRFREALFHFSALFDMLEANVPREHPERLLIEREIFGRDAMNVIACEGSERVERPETYKQWQVRNLRAGFMQLPLNPNIMKKSRNKVRSTYHKDFVIDEDSRWLLQGWKGRIIYCMSAWRPNWIDY
uniref:Scarecrow-like protein 9 n=2 Tax=Anthurium amnicola TaxID=1678845 RepID=A0A1D1YLD4_9ARAE